MYNGTADVTAVLKKILMIAHENRYLDLKDQRFDKLTVIAPAPPRIIQNKNRIRRIMQWYCKCDCGNTRIASTNDLRNGDAHSSG